MDRVLVKERNSAQLRSMAELRAELRGGRAVEAQAVPAVAAMQR